MTAIVSLARHGRHGAPRIPRRRCQRRHQGQQRPRSRAARVGHPGPGGRRLHHEPRAGCAGARVARASQALWAAWSRRSSSTAAAPTRARATKACRSRATWRKKRPGPSSCPLEQVLVASTGVIGVALPIEKIRKGLPAALKALAGDQGAAAARAIMTTDPFPKEAATRIALGRGPGLRATASRR